MSDRGDASLEAQQHADVMRARRDGDGVDHYYSRVLLCRPTSRRTQAYVKASQTFIAILLWFFVPMILAALRRSNAPEDVTDRESRQFGHFWTFYDFGWWCAGKLKFHDWFASDFGFYAFVWLCVCSLVTTVTVIGFWFMIARRQFHRGLFETYVSVHILSLCINLTTQTPIQPGIVLSGHPFIQYAFGLAVEDAEPWFNARLCWMWVVMLHLRDHFNKLHRLTKCMSFMYSLLVFLTTGFLVWFVISTHTAYSAMLVITFFMSVLLYFNATLFPDRIKAWRKETEQAKRERAVQRVENEVMMTQDAFEVGAYEDENDWSDSSVQGDAPPQQHASVTMHHRDDEDVKNA